MTGAGPTGDTAHGIIGDTESGSGANRRVPYPRQADAARHFQTRKVLRVYDPPYLLTRSSDRAANRTPLEVDGKSVRIAGVFLTLLRFRRG